MIRLITLAVAAWLTIARWGVAETPPADVEPSADEQPSAGDDAARAGEIHERFDNSVLADDYPGAISAAEELFELRQRTLGAGHWELIDAGWKLHAIRHIAALPEDSRHEFRASWQAAREASALEDAARYAEAVPLREKRLAWCLRALGQDHPETADSFNKLAQVLGDLGRLADAERHYRSALDIVLRVLGDQHPTTGRSLNNLATHLDDQGRHAEAQPLFEKAVANHLSVYGEEHKYTASCLSNLASNLGDQGKLNEAEALCRRVLGIRRRVRGEDHVDTGLSYNNLATILNAQARYAEAEPNLLRAVEIHRAVLGAGHPHTAAVINNYAANLRMQGKLTQAEPLLREVLAVRIDVYGEQHSETANSYSNIAALMLDLGRLAEAESLYRRTLEIRRQVLDEGHPRIAQSCNDVGGSLAEQGRYAEAEEFYRLGLAARRLLGEEHPDTLTSYNNIAANLSDQGRYAEAEPLFRMVLAARARVLGESHEDTATSYNNLAANLTDQRKYDEAEALHRRALRMRQETAGEMHAATAESYSNLAVNLNAQDKFAEADAPYRRALEIRQQLLGPAHRSTADSLNNVAHNLNSQGRYAEAEPLYRQAVEIWERVLGAHHPNTVTGRYNVARNLLAQGNRAAAHEALVLAASSYEAARLRIAGRGFHRVSFGSGSAPYRLLAAVHAASGKPAEAWRALELDLARGLLDESVDRAAAALPPDEERERQALNAQLDGMRPRMASLSTRNNIEPEEARELRELLTMRASVDRRLADLAAGLSARAVASLDEVQAALPDDAALLAWVDDRDHVGGIDEHWACIVRADGPPIWVRLPGSKDAIWSVVDVLSSRLLRKSLAESAELFVVETFAARLAAQRMAPLLPHLHDIRRLHVVASHEMVGVPVELLADDFTISYVQSGTQLARLSSTPRAAVAPSLLAVGDAIYETESTPGPTPVTPPPGGLLLTQVIREGNAAQSGLKSGDVLLAYAGIELSTIEQLLQLVAEHADDRNVTVRVWRETEDRPTERELRPGRMGVVLAREPAPQAIAKRREADRLLAQRGGNWRDLPGTRVELARLAELFAGESVKLLADSDATEQRLTELLESGELSKFRYLHLATHGQSNDALAFESALILSQDRLPTAGEVAEGAPFLDGRLTAREVLDNWRLNADLVTLSACESGLGLEGGGDGLLGFAQALLLAGSRSVCLSLWKVDDTATALLMDRFYQNLLGKRPGLDQPLPKAEALGEAKRWLRELTVAEAAQRAADLTAGVARGAGRKTPPLSPPPPAVDDEDAKPYAHPNYWAAFVLIGDAE